jgi:O-antigen ligase
MNKKNAILRAVYFVFAYLVLYFVLITAIYSDFARHLPRLMGNWCLAFPQLMFPFNIIYWKYHSLNDHAALLVSAVYFILLAWLFSFLTRPVQKFRWIISFAFCFSVCSVIALYLVLLALVIFGINVEPSMP